MRLILTLAFTAAAHLVAAQCSDAGLCLIGDATAHDDHGTQHTAGLTYRLGATGDDTNLVVHRLELDAHLALADRTSLRLRVPFQNADGDLGSTSGLGDALILVTQQLSTNEEWQLALTAGARLSTGDDNAEPDLPQAYQPGLGTTDVIVAASARHQAWSFAVGYQLVEDTFTDNELTPIHRGDDVYAQVARRLRAGALELTAELQAIQRLAATDLRRPGDEIVAVGDSDKLQVNIGLEAARSLGETVDLTAGVAIPLISRDQNIDGLQRGLTLSVGTAVRF